MAGRDDQGGRRSAHAGADNRERAASVIEGVGEDLSLSAGAINTATELYGALASDEALETVEKRSLESTAVAAAYVATKVTREARNVGEFAAATGVSEAEILRCSKAIAAALDLDIDPFVDVVPFVERYGSVVGLPASAIDRSINIVEICEAAGVASGKNPRGWAAAALYCAAVEGDHGVTQSELSDAADVTTLTIRNRYKEQRDTLREAEPVPEDPYAVVNWYLRRLSVSAEIDSRARDLLSCVSAAGASIEDEPGRWGAAALRRASSDYGDPIGLKALKKPIDADSCEIKSRVQDIRDALRKSDEYPYLPPHST